MHSNALNSIAFNKQLHFKVWWLKLGIVNNHNYGSVYNTFEKKSHLNLLLYLPTVKLESFVLVFILLTIEGLPQTGFLRSAKVSF